MFAFCLQSWSGNREVTINMTDPNLAAFWDTKVDNEEQEPSNLSLLEQYLVTCLASLEHVASLHSDNDLPETLKITSDFRSLVQETDCLKETVREQLNQWATILAL